MIYAAMMKLTGLREFSLVIGDFGLLPEDWAYPAAATLPFMEAVVGFCLILDIRGSLTVYVGLLSAFVMIIGYGIWLGLDIDCGCFGPDDPLAEFGLHGALLRNCVLIGFCLYLYVWRRARSFRPGSFKHKSAGEGRGDDSVE